MSMDQRQRKRGIPPPIFEKFQIFSHFQSTLPLLLPIRAATGFIIKNHLNKKIKLLF